MRKINKALAILTLSFICFFVISTPLNALAASKEYYISNINIEAKVDENGDMKVQEIYNYNFQGDFNGIKRNIKTKGSDGVEDVSVSIISNNSENGINESKSEDNNTFQINKDGNETEVKIFSKSQDEAKSFKINYTLKNVITSYKDVAELKWIFYENKDNVETNMINVFLTLPNQLSKEVKFTGEGPKRGIVENIDNKYIRLQLDNMEDDEVIGAAVQFPNTWVNTSKTIDKNYDEYYEQISKDKRNTTIAITLGVTLAILIGGGGIYMSYSKRKKAIEKYRENYIFFNGKYYEDIPSDITPALVSKLIDGKIGIKDFLATIIYFSNKGIIEFEEKVTEDNYDNVAFSIKKTDTFLLDSEKYLLRWIKRYEKNGKITLAYLKVASEKETFRDYYNHWEGLIYTDAEKLNFYTNIAGKEILTNEYEDYRLKWEAFKDYLEDSTTKDNLKDLGIWQRILPYAVSLEVFEEVAGFIRDNPNYNNYYNPFMNYGFLYYYTNSYQDDFNHGFQQTDTSSNFSGGSGGGGFGGGGGSSAF